MYITFYTKVTEQVTFEELIFNPYLEYKDITTYKKITNDIPYEKAKEYYEKHPIDVASFPSLVGIPEQSIPNLYSHFRLPKKSNPRESRPIDAPFGSLKRNQELLADTLTEIVRIIPHKAAHAYVKSCDTVSAMKVHQKNKSKWFFQTDISSFFPSINEEFIRKQLDKIYPFPFLDESLVNNIVKYGLLNNSLPQGSPLSPMLTNILMTPIDYKITERLHNYKKHHFVYTRYADDITISCKEKFKSEEIERLIKNIFREEEAPFRIKREKTRFGSVAGKNFHLGLIINNENKIALGHTENKKFRAMLHDLCMRLTSSDPPDALEVQQISGKMNYIKRIEPDYYHRMVRKYNDKFKINMHELMRNILNNNSF